MEVRETQALLRQLVEVRREASDLFIVLAEVSPAPVVAEEDDEVRLGGGLRHGPREAQRERCCGEERHRRLNGQPAAPTETKGRPWEGALT